MHFGNFQKYLLIDLTTRSLDVLDIPITVSRKFIGGVGLAVYLLHKHDAAQHDPFEPASPIVFTFSPLVGSPLTTTAKFTIAHRSPLTGLLNDSMVGSRFAIAGKMNGVDAIVIRGQASQWTTIVIDDGQLVLQQADDLVGLSAAEAETRLKTQLNGGFQVASIGIAGENLVAYATVSHNGRHAGRGGAGAMFGAKRLKAIAVRGAHNFQWANPTEMTQYAKSLSQRSMGPETFKYRQLGTVSNLEVFNRLNILPTRNFQAGHLENVEQLALTVNPNAQAKIRAGCVACTIGCEHRFQLQPDPASKSDSAEDGNSNGTKHVRAEYESLFALGPMCGISDRQTSLKAMQLCDLYGLDSISTGGSIAFAMECREKNLIDEGPQFGDSQSFLDAIKSIATKTGIGQLLNLGSRQMAKVIGQDSIDFAPQIKGLELPGYDLASLQTIALGMAVNSRGADHNRSSAYEVDFSAEFDRTKLTIKQVSAAIASEDRAAILDSLILCKFLRKVFDDLYLEAARMLRLATGSEMNAEDLKNSGALIINAKKLFNIKCGWQPEMDTVPRRFLTSSLSADRPSIDRAQFTQMIVEYNRQRGWTDEGWLPDQCTAEIESLCGTALA